MLQRRTHPAGCGLTRGSGFELGCDCIQLRVQRTHPRSNTPSITEKESDFAARCSLQLSICSRLFSRQAEMFRNCPATDFARINSSRSSLSGNLSKICYCRTNNRRASTSTVARAVRVRSTSSFTARRVASPRWRPAIETFTMLMPGV